MQVGPARSRIHHRQTGTVFVTGRDVGFDLSFLPGWKLVEFAEHVGQTIVDISSDLCQHAGVFLQGICEILCHTVPEHDRVGDLHHRALQMQREQRIIRFSGRDLLRIEFPQRRHVHDRAVENFALGQRNSLFQHFHRAGGIHEFDTRFFDTRRACGTQRHGFLAAKEVLATHVGDTRHRAGRPCSGFRPGLHLVGMLPRKRLHGPGSAPVGIAFAQHGIDGRPQDHSKSRLYRTVLFRRRSVRIVGNVVALRLKFRNRVSQLRN